MTYLFPRTWADTSTSKDIINQVASIVPVLKNIQKPETPFTGYNQEFVFREMNKHETTYTNYWGAFYAIFWIMSPIYWIFGFVGSFFISQKRYEKFILRPYSLVRVWAYFFLATAILAFILIFPISSNGIFFNQMSSSLPTLLFSWIITAGVLFSHGESTHLLILRFIINR